MVSHKIGFVSVLAAAVLAASVPPVMAGETSVGMVAGTSGLGAEVVYGITKDINLRGTLRGFNFSRDFTKDDIDYSGDLKLRNGGVTMDWFPFGGSTFHLSAGAMYNGNKITGQAKPQQLPATYQIGHTTYVIDGEVSADIDWRKFAPYLGIGFGNPVSKGSNWGFSLDVGVMFTGSPTANLSAAGYYSTDGGITFNEVHLDNFDNPFTQDLQAEKARLNDDIQDAKLWPVVQFGLYYKF